MNRGLYKKTSRELAIEKLTQLKKELTYCLDSLELRPNEKKYLDIFLLSVQIRALQSNINFFKVNK